MRFCPACSGRDLKDHGYVRGQHVFICTGCGQWLVEATILRLVGSLGQDMTLTWRDQREREREIREDQILLSCLEV